MHTIQIDFDVFKEITARRASEEVTENDVLREVFGLNPKKRETETGKTNLESAQSPGDWITKGVRFPSGTEFRATHKGQRYRGHVKDGALVVNGQRFDSPSAAAVNITENSVNGWIFWECQLPGTSDWVLIKSMRR